MVSFFWFNYPFSPTFVLGFHDSKPTLPGKRKSFTRCLTVTQDTGEHMRHGLLDRRRGRGLGWGHGHSNGTNSVEKNVPVAQTPTGVPLRHGFPRQFF